MFLKKQNLDATKGPLVPLIVQYAIPLLISILIQRIFNMVDTSVLGNLGSSIDVASVAATSTIVALLIDCFIGFSNGAKILLARLFGAKNNAEIKKTADTTLFTSVGIGIIMMVIGWIAAPAMLDWLNCPVECEAGGLLYIRIYLCAGPFILLYNAAASILIASGDSQRPLYYVLICGSVKMALNVLMCLVLPNKVLAVALSTLLSQLLAAFLACLRLTQIEGPERLQLSKMKWSTPAFCNILKYGIPVFLTAIVHPLANLQIQPAVNTFGASVISGNSTASILESIPHSFAAAFGTTAITFMGQNIGAKQYNRVRISFAKCVQLAAIPVVFLSFFLYFTGPFWFSTMLPGDKIAAETGMLRMLYLVLPYSLWMILDMFTAGIQAYGYPSFGSVSTLCTTLVFRIFWMHLIYPHYNSFQNLMLCFLVSRILAFFFNGIFFFLLRGRFEKKIKQDPTENYDDHHSKRSLL